MPRGHITLNGQDYILQDESLISKVVPMFRPQLVVEGITREAQDQYLYMAQDTWDRGSYAQAQTLRWQNGGFGRIYGIDNSIENRIQLQRRTSLSLARPFINNLPNVTRLVAIGGWLLAFSENGDVRRLGDAGVRQFIASDTMNRADSDALGGNWTESESSIEAIRITSNQVLVQGRTHRGMATRTAESFNDAQYSELKFISSTGQGRGGPCVRASGSHVGATMYAAIYMTGDVTPRIELRKFVSETLDGTGTVLGSYTVTLVNGDRLSIEAFGTTVRVLVNNTVTISVSDLGISTGRPGIVAVTDAANPIGHLLTFDDWAGGNVSSGLTWDNVVYDSGTHGAVCFVDVATTSGGGAVGGVAAGGFESNPRLLIGTLTGKVFFASVGLVNNFPTVTPISVQSFFTTRIYSALTYRNHVAVGGENKVLLRPINADGTWGTGDTLNINLPGAPVAMAVWNQLIMIGCQVSTRGSVVVAASLSQAIDTYRVDGGFTIQSLTTWGGQLVYGGRAFRSSEVYSFPGTLADKLPSGNTPTDVLALVATHRHTLAGWNGGAGIWWVDDKGAGALLQFTDPNSTVTDDFNRADANTLGGSYTEQESAAVALGINGNTLRYLVDGGANGAAIRTGTFQSDQSCKLKFVSGTSGAGGPAVRVSLHGSGLISGYVARVRTIAAQTIELVKYASEANSGAGTTLASVARTVVPNDTVEIEVRGALITVRHNGVDVLRVSDTSFSSGSPGFIGRHFSADGATGEQKWDDLTINDYMTIVHQRVRSIAIHRGETFYTVDNVGVVRADMTKYRSSGTITSNWFDGGFPELQKNFADVFVRLQRPVTATESVKVSARVDGKAEVIVGTMAQGRIDATFPIPTALQQGKRLNVTLDLSTTDNLTSPVVTSLVVRYRPIPIQQRVWAFTIKAAHNLRFLDGSLERRKPDQIIADLFALPNSGQVAFFTALELTSRQVYVTNVEMKDQLIGRSRPTDFEESHIGVEVLEASAVLDNAVVANPPQLDTDVLPLEDPDSGVGEETPGVGTGPPNTPEDKPFEFPFLQ